MSDNTESQEAIKDTMSRLRAIMVNIDNMFGDAERLLKERGFNALHTGFQCEQSKAQAVLFVPQYATVFYAKQEDEESEDALTICVCTYFADRLGNAIDPVMACLVFEPRDRKVRYTSWWARVSLFGGPEQEHDESLPAGVTVRVPRPASRANYWFKKSYHFTLPLTTINEVESLERLAIAPLCALYARLARSSEGGNLSST